MKLEELKEKRNAIQDEMKELMAKIDEAKEDADVEANEERFSQLLSEKEEVSDKINVLERREKINEAKKEIRNADVIETGKVRNEVNPMEERAKKFATMGSMSIPLANAEGRNILVSSGNLATPTGIDKEIGQLPTVISSILDDVDVKDATGTGGWEFPYLKKGLTANDHTEGTAVAETDAQYGKVKISPENWDTFTKLSNQVAKQTPIAYANDVQTQAYLALRKKAKEKITTAILKSDIADKKPNTKIDEHYIRNLVTGFGGDEDVAGATKLYVNKADIAKLGAIRGKNELRAVYDITYTDANNGIIKDGGTAVPFSLNNSLPEGTQLYGQPKSVKFLTWGPYEVRTDESGEFFKNKEIAVRGDATGGAGLTVPGGMQIVKQGEM